MFQPMPAIRSASSAVSGKVVGKDVPGQYSARALTLTPRSRTSRPRASTMRPPATGSGSACRAVRRRARAGVGRGGRIEGRPRHHEGRGHGEGHGHDSSSDHGAILA